MIDFATILQSLGDYSLFLILLFIVIIIVAVKITKMLFAMLVAGVIGALFPVIVNDFLKIDGLVESGFGSSITFAVLAVIVYGIYSLLVFLHKAAKTAGETAFLPIRFLAFIGDVTINVVSFIGNIILAPFKYIGKLLSKDDKVHKEEHKEEHKESDDEFWKKREDKDEDDSEKYDDGSADIFVDKTEELVDEDKKSRDKEDSSDSFLSKVSEDYADYENVAKKKKKDED